jgi:3-hydroxyisobutyrate dehydrogenase
VLGSALIPKVLTNCSASALMAVNAEGLVVANTAGLELDVAYEAIAILSGTSLSHVR